MIYYVYIYLDPRTPGLWNAGDFEFHFEPFYVGEGKGHRMFDHLQEKRRSHKTNVIRSIIADGLSPIIIKLKEHMSKDASTALETKIIKSLGTRTMIDGVKSGPLTNLRLHGKNGSISIETREKMSISKKGKTFSDEHKRKLSDARKGRSYNRSKTGPLSELHKKKLSESNLGKKRSAEQKQNMSAAQIGRELSDLHRKKISESCKGRSSPNTKKWKITFDSGESIVVTNLLGWCKERNIIVSSLKNTMRYGTFYKGMKVERIKDEVWHVNPLKQLQSKQL